MLNCKKNTMGEVWELNTESGEYSSMCLSPVGKIDNHGPLYMGCVKIETPLVSL